MNIKQTFLQSSDRNWDQNRYSIFIIKPLYSSSVKDEGAALHNIWSKLRFAQSDLPLYFKDQTRYLLYKSYLTTYTCIIRCVETWTCLAILLGKSNCFKYWKPFFSLDILLVVVFGIKGGWTFVCYNVNSSSYTKYK